MTAPAEISIVLSVVLTVLLNLWLHLIPASRNRLARRLAELTLPNTGNTRGTSRNARMVVPWKAMIVGSLILTVVLNLVLWIL